MITMETDTKAAQKFSFAYHLITWDLVGEPLDQALDFLRTMGFGWFESLAGDTIGSDFARRYMTLGDLGPPKLLSDVDLFRRFALFGRAEEEHGVRLSSLYINAEWLNPEVWPYERDVMHVVGRFLQSCGAPVLVCGGGPPAANGDRPAEAYRDFAARLEEIGKFTQELGVRTVYHPHLDCFVERREQLDRLMDILDTRVAGLCIDPAHLQISGSDPVDIVRTYIDAIGYLHFKDVKGDVTSLRGNDRYLSFCELGEGIVDLKAMADVLLRAGYDGIVVIELDASEKSGEESCRESVEFVRNELGLELNPPAAA